MISFEQLMEARDRPEISGIKTTAFSENDIANLILQRSEIVKDQRRPGRAIKAWAEGDPAPLNGLVEKLGEELIYRAASVIFLEYQEIAEPIAEVAPRKVADIGCGYALFDYFLYQDARCDLFLIDLEQTEERHFGFAESGAAYTSLSVARRFLLDNGIPAKKVTCINPEQQDVMDLPTMDLAMSFISCGFHYPVTTYDTFFQKRLRPEGGIILDVRERHLERERAALERYGSTRILTKAAAGNASRLMAVRSR